MEKVGNLSQIDEMPLNFILEVEIFSYQGFDFQGPIPAFCGNKYTLVACDYISKWVEVVITPTNDVMVVTKFFRDIIFTRSSIPQILIIVNGTHFVEENFEALLKKYGAHHAYALPYHAPTSRQVKFTNREIKIIHENMVNRSRKHCS